MSPEYHINHFLYELNGLLNNSQVSHSIYGNWWGPAHFFCLENYELALFEAPGKSNATIWNDAESNFHFYKSGYRCMTLFFCHDNE